MSAGTTMTPWSMPHRGRRALARRLAATTLLRPLLLLSLLLGIGPAQALTPGVEAPPEPGPARSVAVPAVQEAMLANGLTLIVVPRPGVPLVTARLLVRGGALADPPDRAGLASLTATLLTKGALRNGRPVDATTLARQAEALGSGLSAGAGAAALSLGMTVTTPKLDATIGLLADVLRQPLLAAAELERSRRQMGDALRVSLADPSALAGMVARRVHWGDAPGGALPTPDSLARVQRADLLAFHQRWVRPDATALLLAGDIDLPRARALAQRHLGHWAAPAQPLPTLTDPAPQPRLGPLLLVDLPGSGQSSVVLVGGFSALDDADRRVGQVANAVLGGGYSARLNQAVRVRRGLAYGAGSRAESGEQGGQWQARSQTDHRNALAVAQLLREEVLRLAEQPPTAEELNARQASLTGGFARGLETTAGLAGQVGELWVQRRPWSALTDFAREVQAVQPGQVAGYARRHWPAQTLRIVVVGDLSAAPADWSALAAQPLRLPAAQLDLGSPTLGVAAP